jgi:chloramphenicol-sensitive protein RarD
VTEGRKGFLLGFAAYALWGVFPIYWALLEGTGAVELLAHRVTWSALVMVLLLVLLRRRAALVDILRTPRLLGLLTIAAVTVSVNWGVFIWAVNSGHVVETSLGYFINPLVTVLAGVLVLGERLRRPQWVAVTLAAVAVLGLTVEYGRPPYVALTLAFSFAAYGLVRKQASVGAIEGLAVETLLVLPLAVGYLGWLVWTGASGALVDFPEHLLLLATTGVVTALPLLCFGAAATRVPLTTLGLLQYVAPTLHFLFGVYFFSEAMPAARLLGFALIWVALAVFTVDGVRQHRSVRHQPEPAPLRA